MATFVPVDHDPFAEASGQPKYVPVDHDPFSVMDQVGRNAGLASRAVVNGIMSLPGQILDFPSRVVDATMGGIRDLTTPEDQQVAQELRGGNATPQTEYPSELAGNTLNSGMTKIGVPSPNTPNERVGSDIVSALAGSRQMMGGAAQGSMLRTAPGMQYLSSAAGAGAAGATRESGGSYGEQLAAGLIGGVGAPVAIDSAWQLAKGITKAVPSLTQPFTQGGREKIVGAALNRLSNDPKKAVENLGNYQEFVPDSIPTTGVASGDYGLLSTEKALKNSDPSAFADRYSQQNTARGILLDGIAKNEAEFNAAIASRKTVTDELRDAAFANTSPVNLDPITNNIAALKADPDNAGGTVQKALSWADEQVQGKTDPRALYAARKDIGHAMEGKLGGDAGDLKLARKQLIDVRSNIDASLEKSAPGFGEYLSEYKKMSAPINQMEAGQDIASRTALAAPDTNGRSFISQAKWKNVVDGNKADLQKIMTDGQMDSLNAITADLDRGATINNPAIKAMGSDTVQNYTTAHLIGNVLGKNNINTLTQNIARPLAWIYKLPDAAIHDLLVDAMLDPSMARGFMAKATPQNIMSFSAELKRRAKAIPIGAATGTNATLQSRPQ